MLEWIKRKIGIQETNEETEEKQDIDTAVAEEAEETPDEAAENVQETEENAQEAADNEAADLIKHKAYDFSNAADEEAGNVEPAEESDEAPTEEMLEEEPEEEEPIEETILPEEEHDVVAVETDSTAEPATDAEEDSIEASEEDRDMDVDEDKEEDVFAAESEASSEEVSEPSDAEAAEEASEAPEKKVGWFARLKQGLEKTRDDMNYKINDILGNYVKIDDDMMEDLEDLLISSDMGMETTMTLIDRLKDRIREKQIQDPKEVKGLLAEEIRAILEGDPEKNRLKVDPSPAIILIVGVNGVGKTTTIGKLAYRFKSEGKSVLIAAADTFRAAAIEQIETWGERSGTPVISHKEGADPAAVVYDAIQAQKSRNIDVLICDTAGRLHNKKNLMNELEKIHRIIEKEAPDAQKESLLVLDATTGQNAILQAKTFNEVTDLSGLILTKLDGTAKGGVVLPLVKELDIPIKLIGVGEGMLDLQDFSGKDFANALINAE